MRDAGYTVVEMWECEFINLKAQNAECQAFVTDLDLVAPLQPRKAFFEWRTGAVSLYHRAYDGVQEQIRYVDVASEYPWVNKNGVYPVGHPLIEIEPEEQDPLTYFGLLKVDMLPPTELFYPVLPYRHKMGSSYKLKFPLCAKCVDDESPKPLLEKSHVCTHTDAERTLRGTWCSLELEKATSLGYHVLRIHEVWHFEESRQGLFAPYVVF